VLFAHRHDLEQFGDRLSHQRIFTYV